MSSIVLFVLIYFFKTINPNFTTFINLSSLLFNTHPLINSSHIIKNLNLRNIYCYLFFICVLIFILMILLLTFYFCLDYSFQFLFHQQRLLNSFQLFILNLLQSKLLFYFLVDFVKFLGFLLLLDTFQILILFFFK